MPSANCPGPYCYETVVRAKSEARGRAKLEPGVRSTQGFDGKSYYVVPTELEWEERKACREREIAQQYNQKVLDAIKSATEASLAISPVAAGTAALFCAPAAPLCIAGIVAAMTGVAAVGGATYSVISTNNHPQDTKCGPNVIDVTPAESESVVSQNDE